MQRERLVRRIERGLICGGTLLNGLGALLVFLYLYVVFPPDHEHSGFETTLWIGLVTAYTLGATWLGVRRATGVVAPVTGWMRSGGPADAASGKVLCLPGRLATITAQHWAVAAVFFAMTSLHDGLPFATEALVTILLAGVIVSAASYLGSEWILRPVVAEAMRAGPPESGGALGIGPRILITWLLFSGVPLVMLALIPVGREVSEPDDLVPPILFVCAIAFVAGLLGMKNAVHAIAHPVRQVRTAMDAVAEGDVGVRVPVNDGSEVGRLQTGFNAMVEGLAERERLRDLFGRQVGAAVAQEALERGVVLGGERRTVSVLFVDIIGSTSLASREDPERVVALLNRFFGLVVDVVESRGGMVDKFDGDAALCVFGAPVARDDHAAAALGAARDLRARLVSETTLDAAIGVACGDVVAGNVGAVSRFEYTVIGDPVNEAARLTELAKRHPARLLASGGTLETAGEVEGARWRRDGEALLRGRTRTTPLVVPADAPAGAEPLRAGDDHARWTHGVTSARTSGSAPSR